MKSLALLLVMLPLHAQPARDYPVKPVPFTAVHLNDPFWAPHIEINRTVTIPFAFAKTEETGRVRNFDRAATVLRGEPLADKSAPGYPFDDSDLYKVIEGASSTLSIQPVTIKMKLEKVGPTVINAANNYSEDTTVRVTAVRGDNGATITDFVGTVEIEEVSTQDGTIYAQTVASGAFLPSSINILTAGSGTFVARSLASPRIEGNLPPFGVPPADALIRTSNYPVWNSNLAIPQWVTSDPIKIDPLANGAVFDWMQTMARDFVARANSVAPPAINDLSIVLETVSGYSIAPIQTAGAVQMNHVSKSRVLINPYYTAHRLNSSALHPCGFQTPKGFEGTFYHEARHAFQSAEASLPNNDPDQDFLVGSISVPADDAVPPGNYFLDSTDSRLVCIADSDVIGVLGLIQLLAFKGGSIPDDQEQVRSALEMDAYVFAWRWAK